MKLAAPLRVTWDWSWPPVVQPGGSGKGPGKRKVCAIGEELARARVLMLEVGYPSVAAVRDGLLGGALGGIQGHLSLVFTPAALAELRGESHRWEQMGVTEVWADITPRAGVAGEKRRLPRRADGSIWPDLRLYLTSSNRVKAAEAVCEALESGVRRISLPILPLFGSFLTSARTQVPSWRDLVEFVSLLEPFQTRLRDLDLRVHHQALWTLLAERGIRAAGDEAPGHGGCQAAGAMAYIDPGGTLYPCNALPLPLGKVEPGAIESIWKSGERDRLRESIEQVPPACSGCDRWSPCRGGCRGWAHFLNTTWDEPGPDCGKGIDIERSPR